KLLELLRTFPVFLRLSCFPSPPSLSPSLSPSPSFFLSLSLSLCTSQQSGRKTTSNRRGDPVCALVLTISQVFPLCFVSAVVLFVLGCQSFHSDGVVPGRV
ncbi:hypothetical protein J4Q44_G00158690, partial [Coregonus suidteri]